MRGLGSVVFWVSGLLVLFSVFPFTSFPSRGKLNGRTYMVSSVEILWSGIKPFHQGCFSNHELFCSFHVQSLAKHMCYYLLTSKCAGKREHVLNDGGVNKVINAFRNKGL